MSHRVPVVLAAMLPLIACGSGSSRPATAPNPFANVITREDLQGLDVGNLYDAVDRLRPRWLQVRSGMRSFTVETEVVVYQDEVLLGGPEILERMGLEGVHSIRYLDGPTAKASLPNLGTRHVQGAIIVSMRPSAPDDGSEAPPRAPGYRSWRSPHSTREVSVVLSRTSA